MTWRWLLMLAMSLAVGLGAAPLCAQSRGVVVVRDQAGKQVGLYRESHALLIGVSDYTAGWPDLESVPRELGRVERALKAQGFNVVKVLDPNAKQLEGAFKDFIDDYGYQRGNRLLFFFSGHGHTWEEEGHGYLVPRDAPRPATEKGDPGPAFLRKALFMSDILAWSKQMTAKHALFLFDSCFSGTVFKEKALPGQPPHITRAVARPVREFITAGSAGETVPARSVFTPAFVDALEYAEGDLNKDGYVTGMELGLHLEATVPRHARQSPQFGKHPDYRLSRGDFVFVVSAPEERVVQRRPAQLTVRSNVYGDTLSIDGQARGPTGPEAHELAPGRHVVRVEKEGYTPWERTLALAAGAWEKVSAELVREPPATARRRVPDESQPAVATSGAEGVSRPRAGETWTEPVTGMEFVWVPQGCFQMGSEQQGDADEKQVHRVCVKGYWLGKHEVTQGQWQRVMGSNPAYHKTGDDYPVEQVSWDEAQAFIGKLNGKGRGGLRLPSEAEWEYACRSGGRSETYCGGEAVDSLAWYRENSGKTTHPVGGKGANALGLHDMSGNVWEWVQDCYHESYRGAPDDGSAWEEKGCARRVNRGGAWFNMPRSVRAANRYWNSPGGRSSGVGFRLARTL